MKLAAFSALTMTMNMYMTRLIRLLNTGCNLAIPSSKFLQVRLVSLTRLYSYRYPKHTEGLFEEHKKIAVTFEYGAQHRPPSTLININ